MQTVALGRAAKHPMQKTPQHSGQAARLVTSADEQSEQRKGEEFELLSAGDIYRLRAAPGEKNELQGTLPLKT